MTLCVMEKVTKRFFLGDHDIVVLKGVDLEIHNGEFVAIMGASGSGKTTLMNILGCLDVPTSGRYFLVGKDVTHLDDDELSVIRSEHIGFVFQNFYLLPYATVLENVLLPTLYVEDRRAGDRGRAYELLEMVGLRDRARFKPHQLSGGEQQRVAIARALMNGPELLLADEPTGQLDSRTTREILELLSATHRRGTAIVMVTHDPDTATAAQRIITMQDGRLVKEEKNAAQPATPQASV